MILRIPVLARSYTWGQLDATVEVVKDDMLEEGLWVSGSWEVEDRAIGRMVAAGGLHEYNSVAAVAV